MEELFFHVIIPTKFIITTLKGSCVWCKDDFNSKGATIGICVMIDNQFKIKTEHVLLCFHCCSGPEHVLVCIPKMYELLFDKFNTACTFSFELYGTPSGFEILDIIMNNFKVDYEEFMGDIGRTKDACTECNKKTVFFRCKGCNFARYCSEECHFSNWEKHKIACLELRKPNSIFILSKMIVFCAVPPKREKFSHFALNGEKKI